LIRMRLHIIAHSASIKRAAHPSRTATSAATHCHCTAMWSQTIARKIEDERRWRDGSEAICYTVNASTYTVDAAIGDCADEHELDTAAR